MSDPEGIRKLEAILAADMAGYSRLMQEDDEATVAALEACRAIFRERIQAHRGRVVDMAGDSVLAVFDAATGAVRAAFEIQVALAERNKALAEARRMRFRIGVNLGEVIERSDGTVYGDGVNIAARLESIGEPGGVTVSGTVFDHVKNRVPLAFDFIGEQQVKNITDPVRVYRVVPQDKRASVSPRSDEKRAMSKRVAIGASASGVALLAAVGMYAYRQLAPSAKPTGPALTLPDKPSIAVLPFVNMSDDPEQEYFSDGMTEDVITSLSKQPGLFVIARNSVFTYKGHAVRPEQVSRDLGVRYVLEGSVRKADKQVRITAQLIDATTGYHLWAERYDAELKDIFALQDSVTSRIVTALSPKLAAGDHSLSGRPETTSIEAYDLHLRGLALHIQDQQLSTILATREMFQKAIALDPNYANAYAALAWTYSDEWVFQYTQDEDALNRAIDAARKAVALDDSLPEAHRTLGFILLLAKQQDLGVAELEKAVSLNPNFSWAYAMLALGLNYTGHPDEAVGVAKKAIRLDPKCEAWVAFPLGASYYWLRRYDDAIAALQDAMHRNPKYLPSHLSLAAIYAETGREKEARAEAEEVLRLNPAWNLARWRARIPIKNRADVDRVEAALRNAGLK
ncbi:MAG TPA: adenylate/guanylate cyclase domain-containing protein [Burkholderiales bacterium]|nr:adenylate/guanylate cyclase domain-containing protein [Burkholderiales bacterium]